MLRKIFPPANELTLFVMASTLISLFFYMDGWAHTAARIIADHFSDAFMGVNKSEGVVENFIGIFTSIILFPFIILACLLAPLVMPFTRWDLRAWCAWILLIDCIIISLYNLFMLLDSPTPLQIGISAYCVIWAIYIYICMDYSVDIDYLIDKKKINRRYTLAAATISIVAVFIAIKFFSQHWARAYSLGIVAASMLFALQVDKWLIKPAKL